MKLRGEFNGWWVDDKEGVLFDEAGNHYDKDEIRAIFYYRQLAKGFEGSRADISSLKEELEKKINDIPAPRVTIDWGDIQERYIHPHFRK